MTKVEETIFNALQDESKRNGNSPHEHGYSEFCSCGLCHTVAIASEALSKAGLIRREVDGLRIHEIIDNNMPLPENLRVRDWEYEDIDVIAQALKSAIESGEVFKKGQCQDDWHLGWQCLAEKYGEAEAGKRYKPYRSCPSACGAKVIPGD